MADFYGLLCSAIITAGISVLVAIAWCRERLDRPPTLDTRPDAGRNTGNEHGRT